MADSWMRPTLTLCTYGFFKEMKPSEAFLTPYLESSFKNISHKTISDDIYPISTYSYLVFLLLVLLTTDLLRYKPLIIIESFAYLATRFILVWGNGVPIMQVMQLTYGIASATEIAYYSYIYAMVDEEHYRKVTSYTRVSVLLGKGIADILGQILVTTKAANYLELNYVSLGGVSVAFLVSFFLPKVPGSVFGSNTFQIFNNEPVNEDNEPINEVVTQTEQSSQQYCNVSICFVSIKLYFQRLFNMFRTSYSNTQLLKWSIWWSLAMCGGLQVEDYAMNLWSDLQGPSGENVYNGAVFSIGTLLSALCVFVFSLVKIQWGVVAEFVIGSISIVECVLLLVSTYTSSVWVAYACYIIFRALFAFTLTVASYQIAIDIRVEGYGLIFGWNTFIALCLQSILTIVVADKRGMDLNVQQQFVVYGWYHASIAVLFLARPFYVAISNIVHKCCGESPSPSPSPSNTLV